MLSSVGELIRTTRRRWGAWPFSVPFPRLSRLASLSSERSGGPDEPCLIRKRYPQMVSCYEFIQ
jgi:hypothetical protein